MLRKSIFDTEDLPNKGLWNKEQSSTFEQKSKNGYRGFLKSPISGRNFKKQLSKRIRKANFDQNVPY